MAGLTSAQIVSLSLQDAKAPPGFASQAGQFLNMILGDLCRTWDFEVASKTFYGNFNPGLIAQIGNSIFGSGPYPLPADFLRWKDEKSFIWTLLGVVYPMIQCDLTEFDMMVQQAGIQSYPYIVATDMSPGDEIQQGNATPVFYVYSPPSGTYPFQGRYQSQMADIATPETSNVVPWFPHQGYLRRKTSAALMGLTDDTRQKAWDDQADDELRRYLLLKDNRSARATTVKLDRRRFGRSYSSLPNTKVVGWAVAGLFSMVVGLHGMVGDIHAIRSTASQAQRIHARVEEAEQGKGQRHKHGGESQTSGSLPGNQSPIDSET